MNRRITWVLFFFVLTTLGILRPAFSGGLMPYEIATPEVGLGSAGFAARAQDASTVFTNPAGIVNVGDSQMVSGVQAFYANLKFSQDSKSGPQTGGDGGNAGGWFPGMSLFATRKMNEKIGFGFGVLSFFNGGVDYDNDWVGRYFVQDVTIMGLSFIPAASYKVNDSLSFGVGLDVMSGIFKNDAAVRSLEGLPDGRLKIDSHAWGIGCTLGVLVHLSKKTRIGMTYFSKIELNYKDTPSFENIGPKLSNVLKKNGLMGSRLDVGMNVPQNLMIGFYHEFTEKFALMGDVGWQDWSDFGKVEISLRSQNPKSLTTNRNYTDTWHVALGGQYRWSDALTLTAGVAYDSSMVKDQYRTPDLPLGEQYRFGAGFQYRLKDNLTLDIAGTFMWMGDLDIRQSGTLAGTVSGTYENVYMGFLAANLKWVF